MRMSVGTVRRKARSSLVIGTGNGSRTHADRQRTLPTKNGHVGTAPGNRSNPRISE